MRARSVIGVRRRAKARRKKPGRKLKQRRAAGGAASSRRSGVGPPRLASFLADGPRGSERHGGAEAEAEAEAEARGTATQKRLQRQRKANLQRLINAAPASPSAPGGFLALLLSCSLAPFPFAPSLDSLACHPPSTCQSHSISSTRKASAALIQNSIHTVVVRLHHRPRRSRSSVPTSISPRPPTPATRVISHAAR